MVVVSLSAAPVVRADRTITFNVDRDACTFTTAGLAPGSAITVRPGDVLNLVANTSGAAPCVFVLSGKPFGVPGASPLIGWAVDNFSLSLSSTFFSTVDLFPLTVTVGSVNAWVYFVPDPDTPPVVPSNFILLNVVSNNLGANGVDLPPVRHTLGFDANGGQCVLTNTGAIVDGTWITVPTAEQCTRPGYRLLGWNPNSDGSDPLGFDPGGWTVMTGDNTLYAIWVPVG
jgi:hypothetical protein